MSSMQWKPDDQAAPKPASGMTISSVADLANVMAFTARPLPDKWAAEWLTFDFDMHDIDAAWEAEWPESLALYEIQADSDPNFVETYCDWDSFVCHHGLELILALEQSCGNDCALLPFDQRVMRLQTCPEDTLKPIRRFFERAPSHFKHRLAFQYAWIIRSDRGRRTGKAHWSPVAPRDAPGASG
jgi:hypothetical protein